MRSRQAGGGAGLQASVDEEGLKYSLKLFFPMYPREIFEPRRDTYTQFEDYFCKVWIEGKDGNKRKDLSEIKSQREKSGNEELKAHIKSVNAEE